MSDMTDREQVPLLTLGWRLKMALNMADLSREHMADALGVSPATISRWMADKGAPPRRAYVTAWANETRVALEWLLGDQQPGPEDPEPAGQRRPLRATRSRHTREHSDSALNTAA